MRIFRNKKIVGTTRVSCNQVGVLKVPLYNFKMKWNEMIMNLYSAKTIEEYSKALYIKLN